MRLRASVRGLVLAALFVSPAVAAAAPCGEGLARQIPSRAAKALSGETVMREAQALSGPERDAIVERELLSGNLPDFLRDLVPVTLKGGVEGAPVEVTICVMPDYLAVGGNGDFVRTPLGLPAAARIGLELGFLLPTPRMVDAIHGAAEVRLDPRPMTPGAGMTSTGYLLRHNEMVNDQLGRQAGAPRRLVSGQQKDVVITNRLFRNRGKVAIYGWHRQNGKPIQPLSTVHGANYADYSHGIRLVSATAFVNGRPVPLARVMEDAGLASIVSGEGPIRGAEALMATVSR